MATSKPRDIFDEEPVNVDSIRAKQNLNDPGGVWEPHNENWGVEELPEEEEGEEDDNRSPDQRRPDKEEREPESPKEGEPTSEPTGEPTGEPSIGEGIPEGELGAEEAGEAGGEALGEAGASGLEEAGAEAGLEGAGAAAGETSLAGAGVAAEAGEAGLAAGGAGAAGAAGGATATAGGAAAAGEAAAGAGAGIAGGGWIVLIVVAVIIIVVVIIFIIAAVILPAGKEHGFGTGEEPGTSSACGQKTVDLANHQWELKKPYVYNTQTCTVAMWDQKEPPAGCEEYDCSKFTGWAWYWGSNKKIRMYAFTVADWALARSTPSKYKIITLNNILDKNEVLEKLQPGDLIYEGCDGSSTHVMLYAGNFTIIHAKCTDCGPIVKEPLSNGEVVHVNQLLGRCVINLKRRKDE